MAIIIKKGSSALEVVKKYKNHSKQRDNEDINKYCGILKLDKDPLKLQKKWRDEWQ